jgi:choline dehydrogenase-like flavoprotein
MPAIRSGVRTEFHGSGTTSMMPLELGGVVDTHLRVYGTKNLRIVDAGIVPLVLLRTSKHPSTPSQKKPPISSKPIIRA